MLPVGSRILTLGSPPRFAQTQWRLRPGCSALLGQERRDSGQSCFRCYSTVAATPFRATKGRPLAPLGTTVVLQPTGRDILAPGRHLKSDATRANDETLRRR
jgi:hypothetical protein